MQQVIIAIHLMVVTALVILVLYQKSEGGALGMGGSGVFTGRGQANALTRATGILATIFFLTSIALTVLPAWERRAEGGDDWTKAIDQNSIKFKELKPGEKAADAPAAPEPGKDSIFDQLQRAQQKRQSGAPESAAPVAPPAPAADKPALRPTQEPAPAAVAPSEAPKAEAPKAEPSNPAAPAAEAPKAEAAPSEAPKSEAAPEVKPAEAKPAETKPAPPAIWKAPTQ